MTIETLKKAENIQEKIKRIDNILKRLDSVPVRSLQKKDVVADEDLTTKLTLWFDDEKHLREDGTPFPELHLTYEHIEIMKQAFENHKSELNSEFCML